MNYAIFILYYIKTAQPASFVNGSGIKKQNIQLILSPDTYYLVRPLLSATIIKSLLHIAI